MPQPHNPHSTLSGTTLRKRHYRGHCPDPLLGPRAPRAGHTPPAAPEKGPQRAVRQPGESVLKGSLHTHLRVRAEAEDTLCLAVRPQIDLPRRRVGIKPLLAQRMLHGTELLSPSHYSAGDSSVLPRGRLASYQQSHVPSSMSHPDGGENC